MNKWKKIIFFIMILTICTAGLFIKNKLSQQEEIFVLSEENSKDDLEIEKDANIEINESTNEVSSKEVTVYISGEVNSPGIVTVNSGERLANVVEKVGGVTSNADLNQVNMAIKVEDEEHYIIPKIGEALEVQENIMAENNGTKEDSSKILSTITKMSTSVSFTVIPLSSKEVAMITFFWPFLNNSILFTISSILSS